MFIEWKVSDKGFQSDLGTLRLSIDLYLKIIFLWMFGNLWTISFILWAILSGEAEVFCSRASQQRNCIYTKQTGTISPQDHIYALFSQKLNSIIMSLIILLSGLVSMSTCWQPSESVLQHPFQFGRYTAQSCPTRNTWIWHFLWHEY